MASLLFPLWLAISIGFVAAPASATWIDSGPGPPAAGESVWALRGAPLRLPCRLPQPEALPDLVKDNAPKEEAGSRGDGAVGSKRRSNLGLIDEDEDDDLYSTNSNDQNDYKNMEEEVELYPEIEDEYADFDGKIKRINIPSRQNREYKEPSRIDNKQPDTVKPDTNLTIRYSWYHNGSVIPGKDTKKTVLPNGSLYIKKLSSKKNTRNGLHDTGSYICAANATNGVVLSLPYFVRYASMDVEFNQHPADVTVHTGDSFQLGCHIRSNPPANITWERNQKRLTKGHHRYTFFPSGSLLVTGARTDDGGSYRCIASNLITNKTVASRAAVVSISVFPVATTPVRFVEELSGRTNITAAFGEELLVSCALQGSPKPKVVWDFISSMTGHPIKQISSMEVLRISSPDERAAGIYTCSVENEGVILQRSYQIDVVQREELQIGPLSVSVPAPRTVRFNCSMVGVPPPSVLWYKDGKRLGISGRVKLRPPELIISDTVSSDAGVYQCMSASGLTSAWAILHLSIKGNVMPPQRPHCSSQGPQSVQITWKPPSHHRAVLAYTVHSSTEGGEEKSEISKVLSYTAKDMKPYTPYHFYIKAYLQHGASDPSSVVICQGQGVPAEVAIISNSSIVISWKEIAKNNVDVKYWKVQWREKSVAKDHRATIFNVTFERNVTNFTIKDLQSVEKYEIRVLATTSKEWIHQDLSQISWIQTNDLKTSSEIKKEIDGKQEQGTGDDLEDDVMPSHPNRRGPIEVTDTLIGDTPTDVKASVISAYSVSLSWRCDFAEKSTDAYFFIVCYGKFPEESQQENSEYKINSKCVESISSSVVISGLEPDSLYSFKVQTIAQNHKRPPSPFSDSVTFRTKHDAATSVTDVRWSSLEGNKIKITWSPAKTKPSNGEAAIVDIETDPVVYQVFYSQDPTATLNMWNSKNVTNATEVEISIPDAVLKSYIIVSIWGEDRGPVVVVPPRSDLQYTESNPQVLYGSVVGVILLVSLIILCSGFIVWQRRTGRGCHKCRKSHPAHASNPMLNTSTGSKRSNCISRSEMECQELMVTPGNLDLKSGLGRNIGGGLRAWGGSRDSSRGTKQNDKKLKGIGEPLLNGHINIIDNPRYANRLENGDIHHRGPTNGILDMSRQDEPPDVTLETILEGDSSFGSSTAIDAAIGQTDVNNESILGKVVVHREMTDSNMNSESVLKETVLDRDNKFREPDDTYPNLNYDFRERAVSNSGPGLVPEG